MIPGFPKIYHVGSPEIRDTLFKGYVEVTEKLDGSQIGFSIDATNALMIRSKGAAIVANSLRVREVDKLFKAAVDYIEKLHADGKLKPNTFYYGEVLCDKHHNTLAYGAVPRNNIVLYGIQTDGYWCDDHETLQKEADGLDLDAVALLFAGEVASLDQLKELLNTDSYYGATKIEGVVVKNYHEAANSAFSTNCFGKYVSEKFKEMNGATWSGKTDKFQEFMRGFTNEARWEKAIQHMRDDGKLTGTPKDIGPLIENILTDLKVEQTAFIKEQLFKFYIRQISGFAVKGFPEFYKNKLVASSTFEAPKEIANGMEATV